MANDYIKGNSAWQSLPHRIHEPLEKQEITSPLTNLGNYEGIALKQALTYLNHNNIEVTVEPSCTEYHLYCTAEVADKAKHILFRRSRPRSS